jgi:hypothetical protein
VTYLEWLLMTDGLPEAQARHQSLQMDAFVERLMDQKRAELERGRAERERAALAATLGLQVNRRRLAP